MSYEPELKTAVQHWIEQQGDENAQAWVKVGELMSGEEE